MKMEATRVHTFPQLLESKIQCKVDEISKVLMTEKAELNGLLSGNCGISLFLFNYGRYSGTDLYNNRAYDLLNDSIDGFANEDNISFGFCGGLPGLGWAINILNKNGFIDQTPEDIFEGFDELIWASVQRFLRNKNYDFLHGGAGNFVYFLSTDVQEQKVNEFIDQLESFSIQSGNIIKWDSLISNRDNLRGYNTSVSHGMSSLLEILRVCYSRGLAPERCKAMGYKIINFLKTQDISEKKLGSYFRNYEITSGEKKEDARTRLGWCYGDLGVAFMLLRFALEFEDRELEKYALTILIDCARRRNARVTYINDASVCHGASGVAHMFSKLYQLTQNVVFLSAAVFWYQKTLDMCNFPGAPGGYLYWRPESEGGPKADLGVLEGVAGVGLVLLSAIHTTIGDWDKSLLLA